MTITNDERREVAGHIRQIDCSGFTANSMDDGDGRSLLCAYIAEAVGVGHAPYYFDAKPLCARLADLIEPEPERTCHNVSNDEKWFTCSECGANVYGGSYRHSFVDESGVRWYTTANKPGWNYCPNCRARVTGDEI